MCHCFCCCGYISRKINRHIQSGFFILILFGISLAMVKTDMKNVFWKCLFFFFLYLCHLPAICYSWVLLLKQKVVHGASSFWLVCVVLRCYMLMLLQYLWIYSQIKPDVTLCYHCMQKLELVQNKNSLS